MTNRLPSTNVRIVRFHKIGSPEVLQLDELPLPIPDDAEVRLRVKAIGLNRAEVHFRQSRYRFPPVLPSKIGYEASGIVEAVGRGCQSLVAGEDCQHRAGFSCKQVRRLWGSRNRSGDGDCQYP